MKVIKQNKMGSTCMGRRMPTRQIYFNDSINDKSVKDLMIEIEEKLLLLSSNEKLTIYFGSTGGCTASSRCLVNYLNQNSEYIQIYASTQLSSCALDVYLMFEGDKSIPHQFCTIVAHLGSLNINHVESESLNTKSQLNNLNATNEGYLKFLKFKGFPSDVLVRIERGEDVVLCYEDYKDYLK